MTIEQKASAASANARPPSPKLMAFAGFVTEVIWYDPVAAKSRVRAGPERSSGKRAPPALRKIKPSRAFTQLPAPPAATPPERSAFERLEIGDDVADLPRIEPELRHGRMAGGDSLGQRFGEIFDRIALMQGSERRRDLQWASRRLVDRMAVGAVGEHESEATLLGR